MCEAACPVGMNEAKGFYRQPIAHDGPNHTVATVFAIAQPVAVLDSHLPSGDRSFPRPDDVVHPDVFAEDLSSPAIVISRDPQDLDSGVSELGERGESAEASAWDHRFPLEPEIEEIAVDHQRCGLPGEPAQERHERALDLRARDSQMRVGDDVARRVQHG